MRPGRFHPGNSITLYGITSFNPLSFNEAGAFPPRKSGVRRIYRRLDTSFNEAGAFPPRKYAPLFSW